MKIIHFPLILFLLIASTIQAFGATCEFEGVSRRVIRIEPERNTGLDAIFVAYSSAEIEQLIISGLNGTEFDVKRYSKLGGGYAEEIPFERNGSDVVISRPAGNMGYLVTTSDSSFSFWLVNYSDFALRLDRINLSSEQECENTAIDFSGSAAPIHYYSIDGRQRTLDRGISVSYQTLEWNVEQELFEEIDVNKDYDSLEGRFIVTPPFYCRTYLTVKGDRFLREWGDEERLESNLLSPTAVIVNSKAEQTNLSDSEEASNMIKTEEEGLGGSAPADITFYGYISDAVLHTEWQIASDPEFEYITSRYNEQDLSYVFTEEGRYYVRFIGSNENGSCESIGDTYTVMIGASDLRIPNAFSPNNDGVNDVWKVGYRSLLDFECWIFDSKGKELFRFTDPASGWDGTYRGRTVNPGVYYYVIRATGADGVKYKKSGDINILNYKKYGESTGSAEEEEVE